MRGMGSLVAERGPTHQQAEAGCGTPLADAGSVAAGTAPISWPPQPGCLLPEMTLWLRTDET